MNTTAASELVQPVNFNDMLSSVYLPRPVSLSAKTCQGSHYSMQLIQHVLCAVQTGIVKCATKFRASLNGGAQSDACISLPGWPLGHPGLHAHMTYRVQSQLRQLTSAFCSGHGGVRGVVLLSCLQLLYGLVSKHYALSGKHCASPERYLRYDSKGGMPKSITVCTCRP